MVNWVVHNSILFKCHSKLINVYILLFYVPHFFIAQYTNDVNLIFALNEFIIIIKRKRNIYKEIESNVYKLIKKFLNSATVLPANILIVMRYNFQSVYGNGTVNVRLVASSQTDMRFLAGTHKILPPEDIHFLSFLLYKE